MSRIKSEEEDPSLSDLRDKQRSGRLSSAVNPGKSAGAEKLIGDDRRVTLDDIVERLGISYLSAAKIVGALGFAKVCARWVPRQLTDPHKQAGLETCLELLECHADETFLERIVTGDETWIHHHEPESKKASMEWRHPRHQEQRNSRVCAQLKKLWQLCFGTLKESYWWILCPKEPPSTQILMFVLYAS